MSSRTLFFAPLLLGLACAQQQQTATIEPPTPERPARPGSNKKAARAAAAAGGAAGEDAEFVLSREPAVAVRRAEIDWIHVGDNWWKFRGEYLKLSDAQVRERDNSISEKQAPTEFWDRQTALETALIWSSLCNECHGGRRKIEDATGMPPPPANWGRKEGLFFGQRRAYGFVFGVVYNGGGPPKEDGKRPMPPWRGKLAREQIWALLYFLEFQSGGIEGRFPPSLYPRMPADVPGG